MSVTHIDKGLDLLVDINAIDKWSYQIPTNTYTVYGELRNVDGINHKIYDANELSKLDTNDLYARIIFDFQVRKEDGVFGQEYPTQGTLHQKLVKLMHLIENKSVYKTIDLVNIKDMISNLNRSGYITKEDMLEANKLWRKYK